MRISAVYVQGIAEEEPLHALVTWRRGIRPLVGHVVLEIWSKILAVDSKFCEALVVGEAGLRIISPLTFYLIFLGAIWTYGKNLAPILPYLPPTPPHFTRAPRPLHPWLIPNSLGPPPPPLLLASSSDTPASSLHLMPFPPATNAPAPRSGSSSPSPTTPPSPGPIFSNCPRLFYSW